MKKKLNVLTLFLTLFFSSNIWAGDAGIISSIIVEPYIGYGGLGTTQIQASTGSDQLGNGKYGNFYGTVFGGRAVATLGGLIFIGPDINYFPAVGFTNGAGNSDSNSRNLFRLGLVLGLDVPILPIRFWVGYNFMDNISFDHRDANLLSGARGTSFKVGAGVKILPILSLNAEYVFSSFSQANVNGVEYNLPRLGIANGITSDMFIFSASLPLKLPFL